MKKTSKSEKSRVVLHLFTGSLAGIGKLPALAGPYIRFGIFCTVRFGGSSTLWNFAELLFVNLAGTYFSLKRRAWSIKKGAEASLWGKKWVPAKWTIPKCPNQVCLWYWLGKYRENTNRYQTEIPNQGTALEKRASPLSPGTLECVRLVPKKLRHRPVRFETWARTISFLYQNHQDNHLRIKTYMNLFPCHTAKPIQSNRSESVSASSSQASVRSIVWWSICTQPTWSQKRTCPQVSHSLIQLGHFWTSDLSHYKVPAILITCLDAHCYWNSLGTSWSIW